MYITTDDAGILPMEQGEHWILIERGSDIFLGDFQKSIYLIAIEILLKMSGRWARGKYYSRSYDPRRLVRQSEISSFLLHLYSKNSPKIDQNMHKMSYKMPKNA